jgi:hypothetical protein
MGVLGALPWASEADFGIQLFIILLIRLISISIFIGLGLDVGGCPEVKGLFNAFVKGGNKTPLFLSKPLCPP